MGGDLMMNSSSRGDIHEVDSVDFGHCRFGDEGPEGETFMCVRFTAEGVEKPCFLTLDREEAMDLLHRMAGAINKTFYPDQD